MFKALTSFILLLASTTAFAQASDKIIIDLPSLQKSNWSEQELNNHY